VETERTARGAFDERLFAARLWQLRRRVMRMSRASHPGYPEYIYTAFMMRLLWVVVVVPFLTGAACAFILSR
jgi:hypothetical protein